MTAGVPTAGALRESLERCGYFASDELALALHLAKTIHKPLLVEGEPGSGKTALAAACARSLDTELIRLQCYEGLDASSSLYEWNYARQLVDARAATELGSTEAPDVFSEAYLLERPLLRSIRHTGPSAPVLLIDEMDRADEEFEALLLEILSEFQVTIPELGTFRAERPPLVIVTSNRTRDLSDALKRRCLYLWLELPDPEREQRIVASHVPELTDRLSSQLLRFVSYLRGLDLQKQPGVAESIDWARALAALGVIELDASLVGSTLGCLLKNDEDVRFVRARDEQDWVHAAGLAR